MIQTDAGRLNIEQNQQNNLTFIQNNLTFIDEKRFHLIQLDGMRLCWLACNRDRKCFEN